MPGQPLSIEPLPGQRNIYTAQRNFLLLTQSEQQWEARWVLERDGPTPVIRWGRQLVNDSFPSQADEGLSDKNREERT